MYGTSDTEMEEALEEMLNVLNGQAAKPLPNAFTYDSLKRYL